MLTHKGNDLLKYVPHRFENVLVDKVDIETESTGHLTLQINTHDPDGRHLFLKEKEKGHFVLITPVMMEILALGSIVSRNVEVSNQTVVFASISHFEKHADFPASSPIQGTVTLASNKSGFLRYKGQLHTQTNTLICKGDMLAFFTTGSLEASPPEPSEPLSFPLSSPVTPPSFKSPWMHCADTLCLLTETQVVTQYQYPLNHPLIKGHFPKTPLMMGVMQWMAIEDACLVFCQKNNIHGQKKLRCDALLKKSNGVIVSEIKDVQLETWIHVPNHTNQTEIIATKKIAFRTTVHPGETIFCSVENITIE